MSRNNLLFSETSTEMLGAPLPPGESIRRGTNDAGFTLLETTIALLLMMIVAMGSACMFSFSIYNNSGGSDRAVALALGQQALEILRNAKFNTSTTDPVLDAGTYVQAGVLRDGRQFTLTTTIDDDPSTAAVDVSPSTTLKSITILVAPQSIGGGWASGAFGTVTLITQRARTDL